MTMHDVRSSLLPFLVLIPAAIFCYLPMKNQLRYPGWRIFAILAAAFVAVAGLCTVTVYFWGTGYFNLRYSLALAVCFLIYWRTNTAGFGKSLFIFISACCLISYIEVIAYLLEALSKPGGYPDAASPLATAYELGLCVFFGALFAYPARKNLSWMIDNIALPKIWRQFLVLPTLLLAVNIYCVPNAYRNLYVGEIYGKYLAAVGVSMVGYVLFYSLVYELSRNLMDNAALQQKNNLLSIQAAQYQKQKLYITELSRVRHDMKHTFHLLSSLATEGKMEAIQSYLTAYQKEFDIGAPTIYCKNDALNALLNYYGQMARELGVDCRWKLALPEDLNISEVDLCSLFGNLIENALTGCASLPQDRRHFYLTAETRGGTVYVVSTNSFDGTVKKAGPHYLSTKDQHTGLGLLSMQSIVENHGGMLEVDHKDGEFLVNLMFKC